MADRREFWLVIPGPVRRLPADLAATTLVTLATLITIFVPVINETPLRVLFGLGFVLFLPGYAFIAALFPEAGGSPTATETADPERSGPESEDRPAPVPGTEAADAQPATDSGGGDPGATAADRSGIDGIERVALSFGLSIAVVPLIGLILNFTPWGIRLVPVVTAVAGFTLSCVAVAARRRWALPPDERFAVPYHEWLAAAESELFEPDDRTDAALNVVLAVSVLLAVASVGYAVAVPPQGEQFSEFYLLTETPDGELVADDYPETLAVNDTAELIVGIGNNEYEPTEYHVVVQLQEVETVNNSTTVLERTELDRFDATVEHNETHRERHTLRPTRAGENLRVQYLLYRDSVPEDPTTENAYRELHLWIDVESN